MSRAFRPRALAAALLLVFAGCDRLFDTTKPLTFGLMLPSSAEVPTEDQLVQIGTKALDVKPEGEAAAARATALLERVPDPAALADSLVLKGATPFKPDLFFLSGQYNFRAKGLPPLLLQDLG